MSDAKRVPGTVGEIRPTRRSRSTDTARLAQAPYAPKILPKHCAFGKRDGERCRGFHTKDSIYCAGHARQVAGNA